MAIKFGPAGNSDSFYQQGYTTSLDMPRWLKDMGLDAYEYSCGRGINISEGKAQELGEKAQQSGITLSVHAPYYINLANEEKKQNTINYITSSMRLAGNMKAPRVVIHPGSCGGVPRDSAMDTAKKILRQALAEADEMGLGDIHVCPETLGKINQLGSLDEIIDLCLLDSRLIPTIDFGHLHARNHGVLDYRQVLDTMENRLGTERLKNFHIHFSKIEFTKGGEKRHRTLSEKEYGPDFEPLAELLYKRDLHPTIICESRGTMAEDALALKKMYESLC